jgi:1-acyl-sn-glycerol-3-phosphate acyltransferase
LADPDDHPLPLLGEQVPRRDYGLFEPVGRLILRELGWRIEGTVPDLARGVMAFAPHSSNWDFVVGISAMLALRLRATFIAKHTLFYGPLGVFLRWLGGIPVDRARPEGFVDAIVAEFAKRDKLWVTLAPEGTRTAGAPFKTGFYRIAQAAGVPIFPVYLNYERKIFGFLAPMQAEGDIQQGVAAVRERLGQHGARRDGRAQNAR